MEQKKINNCKQLAKELRREIVVSSYGTGKVGVHIGPALSLADFLAVLYGGVMNIDPSNPFKEGRDRFVLSKGHAYTALYSVLSLRGFFSTMEYHENFMTDGGLYPAHPIKQLDKGIECSTGSLGMGLSFAVGKALNAKRKNLIIKHMLSWVTESVTKEVHWRHLCLQFSINWIILSCSLTIMDISRMV